jgi:hypothetical protein
MVNAQNRLGILRSEWYREKAASLLRDVLREIGFGRWLMALG